MSNSCARLSSLFSRNATNTIKSKLPQIQTPKSIKEKPLITLVKNRAVSNGVSVKDLMDERDSQKLVEKFNSLSQQKDFRSKYKIYDYTIRRLALANQSTLIKEVLESQKKYINGEGFASRIIFLYGKAGLFDHAQKLFDELPERGCEQGARSFNALLGAASYLEDFDKVHKLFRELPLKLSIKPITGSYNIAANALCKLGLIDKAAALLDEMEDNGVKPCVISFNTLLRAFYDKGEFDEGDKIWERMIKSGVAPSILSYDFKLQRLVNDGKISKAMDMVMELKSKGLNPHVGTYNAFIVGACKKGDLDGVRRWYNELLSHGCAPNKVTFNSIVPFLCDKGDYGLVYQVCRRMFKRQCSVDQCLLQKVVDALAKKSMMEEAKILVALGKANSYFPYDLELPTGFTRYLTYLR
ncbi:hypothetical protein SOVF_146030 [Spinacia oleracea]|uniref:Pentatricopeptide repeat-containing protein At1g55890, mitochondrial n=1 Tax=Spinacia oleracea TaxID=3562 RepID=A0A9R0JIT6_SPIOL|nr:pentatricopeptide repeat-containing protein At1g55890, mitochondrial-like [Spinacia oleracea]KNA10241.1 hypothetical protein SOVF_146030 [Spinacia oleracea]